MKKIFNTEQYLGKNKKNYFEGWYFRHSGAFPFSVIIGVSKNINDSHSFIQYIDLNCSHYFRFNIEDFSFNQENMTVAIKDNTFSLNGLSVNLMNDNISICGGINYSGMQKFKKSLYSPSVMGPFSYIPMPCNHCVISLSHTAKGQITVNGIENIIDGNGYIEKDFGTKFPENYFWTHIASKDLSIMCAVAWPLVFGIRGYLCVISYKSKQYNFSLYNCGKINKIDITNESAKLCLKKGNNIVDIFAESNEFAKELIAPDSNGKMSIKIKENLKARLSGYAVLDGERIDFSDIGFCAYEVVLKTG